MSIIAQDLTFTYNKKSPFEKKAVDNVSLQINDGEFVAIVGHTGSGKTTFLQHLNALIRVQQGKLEVCGHDLSAKKPDLKALRSKVGMVFQYPEYQLFADTVLEDVCFGPKNFGEDKEKCVALAKEALSLVGMDADVVGKKSPFDLSGGEKRRVALAGVLAMKPKVLVLDEPTAGLDPRGKKEILSLVNSLNREQGVTVIMVSHDMNEVFENASRVIVFQNGKVAYDLPPRALFRNEEEISAMNLEVPEMARVLNVLEKSGIVLPDGVKTVDDVANAIAAMKDGGENDAS
ncbi:MAG: energy-coupling factor transporter ATPase [Corallococcus sp.]|nr:energy-coupling factor transporter ATPase [Corallococcus sp.]MCM1360034.1 energy-coupling factor transporter ATPase [Corallococcus sp.]MCM1395591.1 energy-coupling factor transporter ATPase [Corallococcus sp.]